eukprot:2805129-Amphidinium_carterae.1
MARANPAQQIQLCQSGLGSASPPIFKGRHTHHALDAFSVGKCLLKAELLGAVQQEIKRTTATNSSRLDATIPSEAPKL